MRGSLRDERDDDHDRQQPDSGHGEVDPALRERAAIGPAGSTVCGIAAVPSRKIDMASRTKSSGRIDAGASLSVMARTSGFVSRGGWLMPCGSALRLFVRRRHAVVRLGSPLGTVVVSAAASTCARTRRRWRCPC